MREYEEKRELARSLTEPQRSGLGGLSIDEAQRRLDRLNELIAERKRRSRPALDRLRAFADDPVGFSENVLGDVLWSEQKRIMRTVQENKHTAVRSCHGPGKSFTVANIVAHWLTTGPNRRAVTTAPRSEQVKGILWHEINDAHVRGNLPGRVNLTEWYLDGKLAGLGRKPADYDLHAFQGFHARGGVLVVLDEACGIPASLWRAAHSITTGSLDKFVAIGNPDDPASQFQKCFVESKGIDWATIKIAADQTPHFTGEADEIIERYRGTDKEAAALSMLAGLVTPQWASDVAAEWGDESPYYVSKVLAEFPDVAVDQLIPISWIKRAQERFAHAEDGEPRELSCDVARKGPNETTIYLRTGMKVYQVQAVKGQDTTVTSAWCKHYRWQYDARTIKVDGNGVGGGVVDNLTHESEPVADMNSAAAATDKRRFKNARAEWWWNLRDLFKDTSDEGIAIDPADEKLQEQLRQVRYLIDPKTNQIVIESKDDMESRGVDSPDRADAVMMLFAPEPVPTLDEHEEEAFVEATMYEE